MHAAFTSAHKQHNFKDKEGRNLINELRNFRERNWWEATKKESWRKRNLEGIDQHNQAPAHEHEDILNEILGKDWDATGTNTKQWMQQCREAANKYYLKNNLPHGNRPKPMTPEEKRAHTRRDNSNTNQQQPH